MKLDREEVLKSSSILGHLILRDAVSNEKMSDTWRANNDADDIDITIHLDGVEVTTTSFIEFMDEMWTRINNRNVNMQKKYKEHIEDKAKELVKDKLIDLTEKISVIEQGIDELDQIVYKD